MTTPHEADDPEREPVDALRPSRRRVLEAAAAGALAGAGIPATAQDRERIELGGNTPGWEGRAPEAIEGEENPTLELVDGVEYAVEWENVDGQPHNFVVEDADGEPIVETDVISEPGATQTVEFEASRAMAEYFCEVHPVSMRGEISIGDEPEAEDEAEPDEAERFFEEGASVGVETVAEGLTSPTDFAVPDGDDRLFITDQTGELWVVDEDDGTDTGDDEDAGTNDEDAGTDDEGETDEGETDEGDTDEGDANGGIREEPFLDVSDRMVDLGEEFSGEYAEPPQDYDERGLLGVEFHPEFEENGRLFVHYSGPPNEETPDRWSHVEVVSEFAVPDGADAADPDSERRIIDFQSPQYNHNAGPMTFGPDGYLYVPMGDGGGANDEMLGHVDDWYDENEGGNGQDTTQNLLGGIHRIDVDAEGDDGPYAIPDDNPLVDEEGHLDEYYSWGWRNPYGISFDRDGRLMVADAGQALFETAYEVEMGGNYGWNVTEGTNCFSTENPGDPPEECPDAVGGDVGGFRDGEPLLDPVVEYPQTYQGEQQGIVIVGGHVYEGEALDDLEGKYIFGDWTRDTAREEPRGRVFAATVPDYGETDGDADDDAAEEADDDAAEEADDEANEGIWEMEELLFEGGEDDELNRFVRQFGRDPNGEVYVLVNARGVPEGDTGEVLKLVPPDEGEEIEPPERPDEEEDENGDD